MPYFAGFVCDISASDLWLPYFTGFAVAIALSMAIQRFGIRRLKHKFVRRLLLIFLIIVTFIGGHVIYWTLIGGNFFCSAPWIEAANEKQRIYEQTHPTIYDFSHD